MARAGEVFIRIIVTLVWKRPVILVVNHGLHGGTVCGHFCVFHVFRGQWLSVHAAIANHAHRDALDGEGFAARVDDNRLEIGVGGLEFD